MISYKPFISVIILSYNNESFIAEAVESTLLQDYCEYEIIISDDCSSDNSVGNIREVISKAHDLHVRLNINEINLGIAGNLNRAMRLCKGEIITVCGGDDISLPNRLSRVAENFKDKKTKLIYSDYHVINDRGDLVERHLEAPPNNESLLGFILNEGANIFGASASWRVELFDLYGDLNSRLRFEDRVIASRALMEGGITCLREPLILYRVHNSSVTNSIKSMSNVVAYLTTLHDMYEVYTNIYNDTLKTNRSLWLIKLVVIRKLVLLKTYIDYIESKSEMRILLIIKALMLFGNPVKIIGLK